MDKTKILFVCMGNICRSPSAEGIMKKIIKVRGLENQFFIDSAGILDFHEGELPDSRMRAHAARRGYNLDSLSRPVKHSDFYTFDMVIGMDGSNIAYLKNLAPDQEYLKKIHTMTEFCTKFEMSHVPDPYYSGTAGFELVLDILEDACEGLLLKLIV